MPILSQREQNKQEKRTRILNAAVRIISTSGIDALTMRHLAEEAGVSSRTPYNLFSSKTDILFAIMLQSIEPLQLVSDQDDRELGAQKLLHRLDSFLALDKEREAFYRSVHWSIMRSDDMEAKAQGRGVLNQLIGEHIKLMHERGELSADCNVELLSLHIGILLASIVGMWADAQLTLRQAMDHTRLAWVNGLIPHAQGEALEYLRTQAAIELPPAAIGADEQVA